jgi:hypothetical protein
VQAFGAVLGVANEAGAKWRVLAEGICLWEVRQHPNECDTRMMYAWTIFG